MDGGKQGEWVEGVGRGWKRLKRRLEAECNEMKNADALNLEQSRGCHGVGKP